MTRYLTTPIYYVNDVPHLGTVYTTLVCDTLARFYRFLGEEVYFLTGTDEHGQKIEKAAEKAGIPPQNFVDGMAGRFSSTFDSLGIKANDFIRTTQPRHKKAVEALWNRLKENNQIYLGSYAGWYSIRDEAFYQEKELIDGKAPTGAEVEWVTEPSYFFKLSDWQQPLLEFYKKHPDFIQPHSRRQEVLRFVEGGLTDLSVSRTSFKWGIPVPGDPSHVIYVWLDALTNYMSSLGYPEQTEQLSKFWPQAVHVVGKDILRFHAVYWPAFLMAAGLPLPKKIFAHGWWTNEGAKMSKSLGNTIDPLELNETFGTDVIRYYVLREVPFGQDGDFSRSSLIQRLNSDLANSFGNLAQRVLSFIHKNCEAKVQPLTNLLDADQEFLQEIPKRFGLMKEFMENLAVHRYTEEFMAIVALANQYIDHQKPWSLKNTDPDRMKVVLSVLTEAIRQIVLIGQPILPNACHKILNFLKIDLQERSASNLSIPFSKEVVLLPPEPVFPRYQL